MSEMIKFGLLWVGLLLFAIADEVDVIDPDRVWYAVIFCVIFIYKNDRDIEGLHNEIIRLKEDLRPI